MIRFLSDADLPRSACIALRQRGYFADDVRDLDLGTATDDTVLQHATTHGYTLISGDKGFTNLVWCRLVSRIWPVSPLERPSPALPALVPGRSPRPAADRRFPTSYSIEDDLALATFVLGGPGAILTGGNILPTLFLDIFHLVERGEIAKAVELHHQMMPLILAIYTKNHPFPLKEAMAAAGMPVGPARPPLPPMDEGQRAAVRAALHDLRLLVP